MMQVKGTALRFMPPSIEKKFGKEGLERWISKLSPYARMVFSTPIPAEEWFPLRETLLEPTANICVMFYNLDPRGAWEFGRMSADYGLRGIYRLFIRFGSPELLIGKASEILPTYYRPSAMAVVESSKRHVVVRISEFPEIDKLIELRIGGWMEAALEICGCKEVRVDIVKSLTRQQPCTEYEITWTGR